MFVVLLVVLPAWLVATYGSLLYYRTASVLTATRHTRPSTRRYRLEVGASQDDARSAVILAMRRLNVRFKESANPDAVCGLTEFSLVTYGEVVTAWLQRDSAGTSIEIESTPVFFCALTDWGRSARNIETLLASIAGQLPAIKDD